MESCIFMICSLVILLVYSIRNKDNNVWTTMVMVTAVQEMSLGIHISQLLLLLISMEKLIFGAFRI